MSESEQSSAYGEWPLQPGPLVVRYPIDLLHEIDFNVKDAARRISHGGMETGGFLFGRTSMADRRETVQIEAFRPIDCEHAFGPSFVLSERDLAKMREQLLEAGSDPALEGRRLLGWYVGHARNPLQLSDHEASLFDRLFPRPGQLTLLVKPERFGPSKVSFIARGQDRKVDRDGTRIAFDLPPLSASAPQPVVEDKPEAAPVPADSIIELPEALELGTPLPQPFGPPVEAAVEAEDIRPIDLSQFDVTIDAKTEGPLKSIVEALRLEALKLEEGMPAAPEPVTPEPVKFQPAPIKRIAVQPPQTEPVPVKPPRAEPAMVEPRPTEPVPVEPRQTRPVMLKPRPIEPVAVQPPRTEPAVSQPVAAKPAETARVVEAAEDKIAPEDISLAEESTEPSEADAEPPEVSDLPVPADSERPVRQITPSGDFLSLEDLRARRLQRLDRSERLDRFEGSEEPPRSAPRPPTYALMQEKPPTQAWKPLSILLALLVGCGGAFWFYHQYFAPSVPLVIDDAVDKLMVSWPPDATRGGGEASIRVNEGPPIQLSMEEKVLGHTEVKATSDDMKVDLVVHHWYGDEHGRARFVKPVITALP